MPFVRQQKRRVGEGCEKLHESRGRIDIEVLEVRRGIRQRDHQGGV